MECDPRVAALEISLCDVARAVAQLPGFSTDGHGDVLTYHADVPFPMFNAIIGSDLSGWNVARRVREILAPYLDRGRPFMWWPLPSTASAELEQELCAAGNEDPARRGHVPPTRR